MNSNAHNILIPINGTEEPLIDLTDCSGTESLNIIPGLSNHNNLGGLQGGSSGQRYHLNKEKYDALQEPTATTSNPFITKNQVTALANTIAREIATNLIIEAISELNVDGKIDAALEDLNVPALIETAITNLDLADKIAEAIAGIDLTGFVDKNSTQTITGEKIYTVSPLIPDGAVPGAAINKGQLDATQASINATITQRITELINNSPTALDTLNELATALGNDPNFATTVTNKLAEKVDKLTNQTIDGVKTFVKPIVIAPAVTDQEAVNKAQLEALRLALEESLKFDILDGNGDTLTDIIDGNGN